MREKSRPTEFRLGNVRCFSELQTAQLRPITILVGENSTGKTTFLGCYSALYRMFQSSRFERGGVDFNEAPFNMGSFKDIVRHPTKRSQTNKQFVTQFGYTVPNYSHKQVNATFSNRQGQPSLEGVRFELDGSFMELSRSEADSISLNLDGRESMFELPGRFEFLVTDMWILSHLTAPAGPEIDDETLDRLRSFAERWIESTGAEDELFPRPNLMRALAPLRASPRRTYDPIKEVVSPEGDHVPMLLNRLTKLDPKLWRKLQTQLNNFGQESGMFSKLNIRSHGEDMSDPFQIEVQVRSKSSVNLMDVGYGVSQGLPILVEVLSHKNTQFVMQQPEVHLHPKAQAALATLLVDSVSESNNQFLIETHSDFVIDRVRINVKQGRIDSNDVSILFFEPHETSVKIHNLTLDEYGELEGAPNGYRDFFLHETDRLLGFEEID